jgi:hypothetical protein
MTTSWREPRADVVGLGVGEQVESYAMCEFASELVDVKVHVGSAFIESQDERPS